MKGEEVKNICLRRAKYHVEKKAWYEKQVQEFEKAKEEMPQHFENTGNNVSSLKTSVKRHDDLERWFSFVAEHVVVEEEYQLTTSDMNSLEITEKLY